VVGRKIISLNDANWRVGSVRQKPFGDVNDLAEVTEWLPAQVPGDVRLDLLRAGKINDPFFADNNEASQWVDARDWWYVRELEKELELEEELEVELELELEGRGRAFLVFEGIDYQSAVFWNGKPLGRHVGMFSRQVFELPTKDKGRKTNDAIGNAQLAVRIWGSDALPKLHLTPAQKLWARLVKPLYPPPSEPFPDRYATLKCQMQFGWDFAPRLRTCGIWDEAHIIITHSVFIQDVWIKVQVPSSKVQVANLAITLMLDSDREQDVRVAFKVRGKNFADDARTFVFDVHLLRGTQVHELSFDLENVQLWNPWDRGEPNLYEIETRVEAETGEPLDTHVETFGIRSFELARTTYSREPWQFVINGEREFVRGANWVPMDALPARLTRNDYAARLQQARDANINFLRVWGGGLREKRAFYDLCDELGILVWQEFPFAGAILDRFPTHRAHLQLIRAESGEIVRALRNHPSLVVWCGGNEFNPRGNHTIVKTLRAVVKSQDGTRPFKPASPYRDESHNWRVWHRLANLRDYRQDPTPFLSEFGLQALPNLESLKKFLPADALNAPHRLWEYHHAELKKLGRYAQPLLASRTTMTVPEFIDATQRAQAFALQIAIEHMRRRKRHTAGVAIWQLNDCWPSISWSVIDYYGTPKRAYFELQKLYSPVLASFEYELRPRRAGDLVHGHLWLINDLLQAFDHVELRAELNGKEIYAHRVNLAPDSAQLIEPLTVKLDEGENILRLVARVGECVLSNHTYDLNFCDVGEISLVNWLMVQVSQRLMR